MKLIITKGATSVSVDVFIRDSSVGTGVGLTGLVFNTASLTAYYSRQNAAATAITLATQTATGAFSSGGFVAVDGTNMPGLYRLDIPDAVLASGVNTAYVMLKGATNMEPCLIEIELAALDLQDGVRAGLTALPSVASGSAGAIVTSGTGTAQLSLSSGLVTLAGVTHTGAIVPTVTTLTNLPAITANWLTAAGMADDVSTEIRTKLLALTVLTGTVGSGSTTANVVSSAITPATTDADQLKGRVIIFNNDTATVALRGQAATIVSHTAGATPTFTVAAASWTTAPLTTDSFTIV